jgi:hypothetical protein
MAAGAGLLLVAALWLVARTMLRRTGRKPGLVFYFAAVAIATWGVGAGFFPGEVWVNHAGAVALVAGAMLAWAIVDRVIFSSDSRRNKGVEVPTILRQLIGFGVMLAAVAAVLT